MYKVAIFGCYGIGNLGDDVIMLSLIEKIHEYNPKTRIDILAYRSEKDLHVGKKDYVSVTRLYGNFLRKLVIVLNCIKRNDGFIIGGGGLFPNESVKNLLKIYLYSVFANYKKKKIIIHGVEITSAKKNITKYLWRLILGNVDYFYSRNEFTLKTLKKLSKKNNVYLGADVTFSIPVNKQVISMKRYVLLSIAMPWSDYEMQQQHFKDRYNMLCMQLIKLSEFFIANGYQCMYLPFYENHDDKIIADISKELPLEKTIIIDWKNLNPMQKRELFSGAYFALTMRFHSVLFAIQNGTPFWSIAYSPKSSNILKEHKLDNYSEFGIRDTEFFYCEFDIAEKEIIRIKEYFQNIDDNIRNNIKTVDQELIKLSKNGERLLMKWVK